MENILLLSIISENILIIDIVLGAIIIWGGYKGFKKGFLLEILSIFIFVAGVILIFFLIAKGLSGTADMAGVQVSKSVAFGIYVVIYLIVAAILNSIGKKLQDKIDYSILDDFDNVAGMLVGALKYMVFLSIFIWLFNAVGLKLPIEITKSSVLYPRLLAFQEWLVDVGATISPAIGETAREIKGFLRG